MILGIFIIGAPAFFGTVWGWVKRWFDPVTVSKIFILNHHEVIPVLTQFMDIKDIPKAYGGELDWSFFDDPAWGDEIKRICQWEDGYTALPRGPLLLVPIDDGRRLECVAIGTKDGKDRRERVCTITKAFPPQSAAAEAVTDSEKVAETNRTLSHAVLPTENLAELSVAGGTKTNGVSKLSEKTEAQPTPLQETAEAQ